MKPLQISPETALKLSKSLNLPLEQIMHMPTPILLRKLAEAEAKEKEIQNSCRNLQLFFSLIVANLRILLKGLPFFPLILKCAKPNFVA